MFEVDDLLGMGSSLWFRSTFFILRVWLLLLLLLFCGGRGVVCSLFLFCEFFFFFFFLKGGGWGGCLPPSLSCGCMYVLLLFFLISSRKFIRYNIQLGIYNQYLKKLSQVLILTCYICWTMHSLRRQPFQ